MLLREIRISNFRCFGKDETKIRIDKLTTLVGANSTGKTALIQAIVKMFGPSQAEREIHRSDFHLEVGQPPESLENSELYIEAVFYFPELQNRDRTRAAVPTFFKYFIVDSPEHIPYIRIRLESSLLKNDSPDGEIDTRYYFIVAEDGAEITDSIKINAPRNILTNIKCIYVPALRNPSDQLRNVSGTILYRLLSDVDWTTETKEALKENFDEINHLFETVPGVTTVQDVLQDQWKKFHNDSRYANTKITFATSEISSILKNAEIKFSPTELPRDYNVGELGDGLRSLFYFSLVNTLLRIEQKALRDAMRPAQKENQVLTTPPVLSILAVEEPENHIAPQLMGKVILNLKETSECDNAQVILSSHTPAIVKRIDVTNLRYLRLNKQTQSTLVNEILLPSQQDTAYKFIKEAVEAYPEIYFARFVVLGEGDSETLVLPKIIERTNTHIDVLGIAVAPLGGRYVNHFWRLLYQLDIPHLTLLDFDKEREGGGWGRIKYALSQLIENGVDRNTLLKRRDSTILSPQDLNNMHTWKVSRKRDMNFWISRLATYNVYFSYPLDLDFLLLEKYTGCYKDTVNDNEGPRIPHEGKIKDIEATNPNNKEYLKRIRNNVKDVLKEEGGSGMTYTIEQKRLMVWYKYLFLDRSKPSTHLAALSTCDFSDVDDLPTPLVDIVKKIMSI